MEREIEYPTFPHRQFQCSPSVCLPDHVSLSLSPISPFPMPPLPPLPQFFPLICSHAYFWNSLPACMRK